MSTDHKSMPTYQHNIDAISTLKATKGATWDAINPEYAARMRLQNRFKTGLDFCSASCSECLNEHTRVKLQHNKEITMFIFYLMILSICNL